MADREFAGGGRVAALALLLLAATLAPIAAAAQEQAEARAEFTLPFATTEIFPLFLPGGRALWDQEWDIEILEARGAGAAAPGTRFFPRSDPETIWRVEAVDEALNHIEYSYEKPGVYDMTLRIECEAVKARSTLIRVTYLAMGKSKSIADALTVQLQPQITEIAMGPEGWRDRMLHFLQKGSRMELYIPVAISRRHEFRIDADPDRVFAAANPAGGNHWSAGSPDYVFGNANEPAGAVWRRGDSWFAVGNYDIEKRSMTTVLSIPQTEFLLETLRCDPHPEGGTRVTVEWRVAGVSRESNGAVRDFFAKHWDARMASIEVTYRELLGLPTPPSRR